MDDFVSKLPDQSWHRGEVAIQRSAGVAEMMAPVARQVIRGFLIEQHRAFFPRIPFVVAGAVDPRGDVWATMLAGEPGFLYSPDPTRLNVAATLDPADPASAGMEDGDAIGLLGIELPTRRRNRLNGHISRANASSFDVVVSQSYGNCPQYIRQRQYHFVRDPAAPAEDTAQELESLDAAATAMIAAAETLFMASYVDLEDGRRQVDVSHKGGRPGFIHIATDGVLTIPDFAGNLYFNTLGNILLNPKCGLAFIDFDTGNILQLSGDAEVLLDAPEISAFQGAERLLRFTPRRIVFRAGGLPLRWSSPREGISQNTLLTGTWEEASSRIRAANIGNKWREFRVAKTVDESAVIRSLYLVPTDGAGIKPHRPGQHITIRVQPADGEKPLSRSYTLSSAPSDNVYRISVKREGTASALLHSLAVGDIVEARAPGGDFILDTGRGRPVILLAAGVGVTPLLSMLRHIVYEGQRTRQFHPTWFIQSARSKAERAFDAEISSLVAAAGGAIGLTRVLSDTTNAGERDFEVAGRITMELLQDVSPLTAFDFYICGPASFTQDLYDGLRKMSVPDNQIFAEAFGPSSLQRSRPTTSQAAKALVRQPVDVTFSASGKQAKWSPQSGTLLDFAESLGLAPAFDCRRGTCGTCAARVISGTVAYVTAPSVDLDANEALICCAVPAGSGDALVLDL